MSDEKPSPGPWQLHNERPWLVLSQDDGLLPSFTIATVHTGDGDAALIADAWQLPQLREDNRVMLELLAKWASAYESSLPRGPHAQHCDCRYHLTRALLDKHGRG
jgi:hypothetical protein